MFGNYLRISLRILFRHKGYSAINLSGLVVGFVACILILLFVQDELSFDRFHAAANRTYRVTTEEAKAGGFRHLAYSYGPAAPALLSYFPEIEQAVRVFPKSVVMQVGPQRRFQEENFIFADSTFFDIFSFEFEIGDPGSALDSPYDIVLTAKSAQKYFGDQNPIGKTLNVEGSYDFRVAGVLKERPPARIFPLNS